MDKRRECCKRTARIFVTIPDLRTPEIWIYMFLVTLFYLGYPYLEGQVNGCKLRSPLYIFLCYSLVFCFKSENKTKKELQIL